MALLAELEAVLESCGGFKAIEEFGPSTEIDGCWCVEGGLLFLRWSCLREVWREAKARHGTPTASTATLLLVGDAYSAWNVRKRRRREDSDGDAVDVVDDLEEELAFNAVVLKRHPKAAAAWSHRRWLLKEGASEREELALCETLALRHPRNYFAWTHRAWVAERLGDFPGELDFAARWLRSHVTDHSAAHYAASLASKLSDDDEESLRRLDETHSALCASFPHLAAQSTGNLAYLHRAIHRISKDPSSLAPLRHPRSQRWLAVATRRRTDGRTT
mmetsp:Transcript_6175/g.20129  ORF Transcript_6175/g.20129 Transcript_6175/m.20129 type:complete len:275 (+) Transcript_6175:80-904(+)